MKEYIYGPMCTYIIRVICPVKNGPSMKKHWFVTRTDNHHALTGLDVQPLSLQDRHQCIHMLV